MIGAASAVNDAANRVGAAAAPIAALRVDSGVAKTVSPLLAQYMLIAEGSSGVGCAYP